MCTPTATPPKWLVDQMPDMVALDENGQARKFGSRRHYSFSHKGYQKKVSGSLKQWQRDMVKINIYKRGKQTMSMVVMKQLTLGVNLL